MHQVCRLWLHVGDPHSGAVAWWAVVRGYSGWQQIQGAEERSERWLPYGWHRVPGGPEGQGHKGHKRLQHTENVTTTWSVLLLSLSLSSSFMAQSWSVCSISTTVCTSRHRTGISASAAALVSRLTGNMVPCQKRRKTFRCGPKQKPLILLKLTTHFLVSVQDSDSCCPPVIFLSLLTILCFCLSGLTQWSGLVLVVAVCPPARPFLQNHYPVSNHTQRPPGTPPHGPWVLLSEIDPTAQGYCGHNQLRVKCCAHKWSEIRYSCHAIKIEELDWIMEGLS